MIKNQTLTIGIPAYNEEANIGHLLEDLAKQKYGSLILEHIIVASDGSTDKTNDIVSKTSLDNVKLINNTTTEGQAVRQNQIISMSKSDILVILNADIMIEDEKFIQKLVKPICEGVADLTSCPIKELSPRTYTERAIHHAMSVKQKFFESIKKGNNIYTCHGTARGFSRNLYTKLKFTSSIGEDAYSYLYCIKNGFKYKYVNNTCIYYQLVNNVKDYNKQNNRFLLSRKLMIEDFGDKFVNKQYSLPFDKMTSAILRYALNKPVLAVIYIIVYIGGYISSKVNKPVKTSDVAISSKFIKRNI